MHSQAKQVRHIYLCGFSYSITKVLIWALKSIFLKGAIYEGHLCAKFLYDILNIWYVHIHTILQQNAQAAQTAYVQLLLLNPYTILILLWEDTEMELKYILLLLIFGFVTVA